MKCQNLFRAKLLFVSQYLTLSEKNFINQLKLKTLKLLN